MSEAKKKRNSYGPEFKAKVGLEAVRGAKTINEIAREYGVHPVLVGQWKKEILEQAGTLFEGKRGPKREDTHESEDRLYGEIGRLKMELDWLKKSPGSEGSREDGVDRARRRRCVVASMRAGRRITGKRVSPDHRARAG
jgi:transposase